MEYFAHTKGSEKKDWQRLIIHLQNTADLAREFGQDAGVSELAYIAGLIHDLGKYSLAFQKRLEGAKEKVDHSTAGAKEIDSIFHNLPAGKLAILLSYCVIGHHAGLPDIGSPIDLDGAGTLNARLKAVLEDYSAYKNEVDLVNLQFPRQVNLRPLRKHAHFTIAFLTRMIFSALVDADFQDTEKFVQGEKPRGGYTSIERLLEKLNEYLQIFSTPQNAIDQIRSHTLKTCIEKSSRPPGFFTLTVPTGGGKTLASLAFALNHAKTHGLKRIIYVIPFTSIIEQNAAVFKDCLGSENVLEHHSNFEWEKIQNSGGEISYELPNSAYQKLKLAAENWDIPIVATTNVQFFESLFANRSSRCRKLHNIAKSVLIFDEAQMLPREFLTPTMAAVWELVTNYQTSAVFCTATQPSLQRFFPEETLFTELADDPQRLFDIYRRVQINTLGKLTDENLLTQMNEHPQSLCIVNTRKHARGLFEGLEIEGRFHLSTLMCPAHRKKTLEEIRQRLKTGQTCRVVSTQVIEAGIDVDFPIGYRAMAGLDSIIQAAGRVNREGKTQSGQVFVFEPDSLFVSRVPAFIEQGAAVTRSILREYATDPISIPAINAYFEQLYSLQDGDHSFDTKGIMACFDKSEGFDFASAAKRFHLIEENMRPILIPYDSDAVRLIAELKISLFPASILRKLQMYTVNVYEQEFDAINNAGGLDFIADMFAVLNNPEQYNAKSGLLIPEVKSGSAVFY